MANAESPATVPPFSGVAFLAFIDIVAALTHFIDHNASRSQVTDARLRALPFTRTG